MTNIKIYDKILPSAQSKTAKFKIKKMNFKKFRSAAVITGVCLFCILFLFCETTKAQLNEYKTGLFKNSRYNGSCQISTDPYRIGQIFTISEVINIDYFLAYIHFATSSPLLMPSLYITIFDDTDTCSASSIIATTDTIILSRQINDAKTYYPETQGLSEYRLELSERLTLQPGIYGVDYNFTDTYLSPSYYLRIPCLINSADDYFDGHAFEGNCSDITAYNDDIMFFFYENKYIDQVSTTTPQTLGTTTPCDILENGDISVITGCKNIYTSISTSTPSSTEQIFISIPFILYVFVFSIIIICLILIIFFIKRIYGD